MSADTAAPHIGVVVLAGGVSRRFGGDKRRAHLPGGAELLATTVARYATCFDYLRVGLRAEDDALASTLAAQLGGIPLLSGTAVDAAPKAIVRCTSAARGMGATLAAALATQDRWDAAAIALGDMPFVTVTSLRVLRNLAAQRSRIGRTPYVLQPTAGHVPGHPVIFSKALFPELLALDGDRGAREVVQRHLACRQRVELCEPGIVRDVDTPAALTTYAPQ